MDSKIDFTTRFIPHSFHLKEWFFSQKNRNGFTLIETLVVVLIIGVLAAIALPQYRKSVAKTRISALIPLMRSIQQAQARYQMANGTFAKELAELDIDLPCVSQLGIRCYLSKFSELHLDEGYYIIGSDSRIPSVALLFFYQVKSYPAACYAWDGANEKSANELCASLTDPSIPPGRINGATLYYFWR